MIKDFQYILNYYYIEYILRYDGIEINNPETGTTILSTSPRWFNTYTPTSTECILAYYVKWSFRKFKW